MVGKALSPLAPLCKGELLLQCEALPTIEGLLTEVSEKRKGCGRKAIPPVVARIFSGDSTSPLTRDGHGCPKLNAQSFARMRNQQSVHMARMWCEARDYRSFATVVGMERLVGDPSVLRQIGLSEY